MQNHTLSDSGGKEFLFRLINLAHDRTIREWHSHSFCLNAEEAEILFDYCSGGVVNVLQKMGNGRLLNEF